MRRKRGSAGALLACDGMICALQLLFGVLLCRIGGYPLLLGTLMVFLSICVLFGDASGILTHQMHDLAIYTREMVPRCAHLLGIAVLDVLCWVLLQNIIQNLTICLVFELLMLLCCTVVCFAIGAARTMLHLDC